MQNICLSIVIYLSDFLLFGKSCFHEISPKLGNFSRLKSRESGWIFRWKVSKRYRASLETLPSDFLRFFRLLMLSLVILAFGFLLRLGLFCGDRIIHDVLFLLLEFLKDAIDKFFFKSVFKTLSKKEKSLHCNDFSK